MIELQVVVLFPSNVFPVFSKFSAMNTAGKTFLRQLRLLIKMWKQVSGDFYILNNVPIFLLYLKKEIWESLSEWPFAKGKVMLFSVTLTENSITLHSLAQVSQYGGWAQKRGNSVPWLILDPKILFPPFFSVLISLGDKICTHGFDHHLYTKNSNAYFYRTISSFPYLNIQTPIYMDALSIHYKMNKTSTELRSISKGPLLCASWFREWHYHPPMPQSRNSEATFDSPPPIQPLVLKILPPVYFSIFSILLNSLLQPLTGSSIYLI